MKKLYEIQLEEPEDVKEVTLVEGGVSVTVGDKKVVITTEHSQDCCEAVYGDFTNFLFHIDDIKKNPIKNITIYGVEQLGLVVAFGSWAPAKVLVPCYNNQSGYYSDELILKIKEDEKETVVDLRSYKEDNID